MSHLGAIGNTPRPAGSEAAKAAQSYCATQLTGAGFSVTMRPFEYSALPGRYGAPIVGGVAAVLIVLTCALGARSASPTLFAGVVALSTTSWLASWMGGPKGTRSRFLRHRGTNLEAVRGDNPRVWLVAHIDSKSQSMSTAVRTIGVLLVALGLVVVVTAVVLNTLWFAPLVLWIVSAGCAVVGGGILIFCRLGAGSDGAADNASGVAAVLEAAALASRDKSFGVLITDAEELALAGARAWVESRTPAIAINCDTIDDAGITTVIEYAPSLALAKAAVHAVSVAQDVLPPGPDGGRRIGPVQLMKPLPGVLTDSVAFRDAGWETVTLARGNARTLNRIHTVRDNLQQVQGTGIPGVARALAGLIEELG